MGEAWSLGPPTAHEAERELRPHLADAPFDRVLVHGRAVTFCDSAGLQFLLRLGPRLRARHGVALLSESRQLAILSCTNDDCPCRLRVEAPCPHGDTFTCACGHPLAPVDPPIAPDLPA